MIRNILLTAWMALLVPLLGVGLAAAVGFSDARLGPSDPDVAVGFIGGAAAGVGLWILGMQALLRREGGQARFIWHFMASWPVALTVWFAVRLPGGSGGAAAPTVVLTLLGWWYVVWAMATTPSSADFRS